MSLTVTRRLVLRPIDRAEAERISTRHPSVFDRWAPGYPFEGDLEAISAGRMAYSLEQGPVLWGYHQIRRRADGLAIGGVGFFGPPDDEGAVEVGYGLIPGARGRGYAAEALAAMLEVAARSGARIVRADTTVANVASQKTALNAGMVWVPGSDDLLHYEWWAGDLVGFPARVFDGGSPKA